MRAGTLRERIVIQAPMTVHDPSWGPSEGEAWEQVANVAASVTASGAGESVRDDKVQSTVSYTIKLRHLDGIDSKHRIVWRGRTLDIVSVTDPTQRRRELVIEAKEHESNG
jgi:SPP1 family predicted phage head-tail adaptor